MWRVRYADSVTQQCILGLPLTVTQLILCIFRNLCILG
jgi:hypothetical protein